jgi:meso-butanediol dehydrogenase / (S,S)-butanediol dehydrogenase / diacetyl reductase
VTAGPGGLDGAVALVTGAARGIGRAIALRLAADGADVAVVGLAETGLSEVADEIAARGSKCIAIRADVREREEVHAAVARTRAELGSLDVMVNNAGIVQVESIDDITPEHLDDIWRTNVASVVWGTQAAARSFMETGTRGTIVNASAGAGHEGFPMLGSYCATKFAVRAFTQTAAKELGEHGITVNCYCPGIVDTDMWVQVDEELGRITGAAKGETFQQFTQMIALGRPQTPDDVAGLVSYLTGRDGRYVTGQSLIIDGGVLYR